MEPAYNTMPDSDPRYTAAYGVNGAPARLAVSAVSWPAILSGTFAAIAVTMVLGTLGSGLGLSMASPYSGEEFSPAAFTIKTAIWLIVIQWLASGLGGYVAGRLRNRWEGLHGDEVFFRDSAHGFTSWAVSTVLMAAVLITAASNVVGTGAKAATAITAAKVSEENGPRGPMMGNGPYDYYLDTLFRTTRANAAPVNPGTRMETARILMMDAKEGSVTSEDKTYLTQLVANQAGVTQVEAQTRVETTLADIDAAKAKAKEAADEARKTAATFSILVALSMVIGAFIAGVTGIIGGRDRDAF